MGIFLSQGNGTRNQESFSLSRHPFAMGWELYGWVLLEIFGIIDALIFNFFWFTLIPEILLALLWLRYLALLALWYAAFVFNLVHLLRSQVSLVYRVFVRFHLDAV